MFLNKKIKSNIFSIILFFGGILSLSSFTFQQNGKEKDSPPTFQSINYWNISRTYPFNKISSQSFVKAKEYSAKNFGRKLHKINEPDPWKAIGPNNIGGRTLCIGINPKRPETIYAGSAGGGLWRSYTGGKGAKAWEYISTGFPVLAVSAIAIDPGDTNKIYIGTGEVYNIEQTGTGYADRLTIGSYGIGIIKTTDGGINWQESLSWEYDYQVGVQAIRINPLNTNTIWAATTEGTYKSTNYGAKDSWKQVHNIKMANDLVINPVDPNKVIIACGNLGSEGNGLYKTEDGGDSWITTLVLPSVSSGLLVGKPQLSVCQSNPDTIFVTYAYGDYRKNSFTATWCYKTENGGAYWVPVNVPDWTSIDGWYSHDIAVNPNNPNEIFAAGINVWKSINGAKSFAKISNEDFYSGKIEPGDAEGGKAYVHKNVHDIVYHPANSQIIYFATDGGIFRTTDSGENFEACNGGYQTANFDQGFSLSQDDKSYIIATAYNNGTNIYTGSGAWFKYILPFYGGWTGINSLNDSIVYSSHQYLKVFKSVNRGNSFKYLSIQDENRSTAFYAPFVVGTNDPGIMYAGRDKIYKSYDGGEVWFESNKGSVLDGNPIVKMAIAPQDYDIVYAATFPLEQKIAGIKAGLFRTANGGTAWVNITAGLPDRFIGSIYVDPGRSSTVYVTLLGFGSSHLYKSTDLGVNWTDIGSGLPDVPTSAVIVDSENLTNIYVGNDLGIYFSPNNGITWESFSSGLPEAIMVSDLKIYKKERLLRISTNGAGFFERELAENATVVKEEIINQQFQLYQNYPNPFNPVTKISFIIPAVNVHNVFTTLKVYDILGREIAVLVTESLSGGSYTVDFNASDLSSGVYYYRLQAGNYSQTKKMLLLK